MEMIFLHSMESQLRNNDICQTVTSIRPRSVNIGNCRLIEAKMKGCQVRDWIVGEREMSFFTNFIHDMCE